MSHKKYSRIISGTMSWGNWGKAFDTNQMAALIEHCFDHAITTFDHADIYGGYTTEAQFGKAFKTTQLNRNEVQFISKCGIQYVSENRNNLIKHYNYSKDYIIWSVEQSLNALQTDYIDALLLHRPSPLMHPHDVMEAVTKLQQDGKIKEFGVSNFTRSQVELISSEIPIAINQIEFSLTHCQAMHDGILDQMMVKKIQPMAWSPLGYTFKEDTEQTRRIHKQLGELLEKYNATEDQLLLAWIMKHPTQISPVVGTTDKKRLINAVQAQNINLELEDWFSILVASQGHKVP